MESDKAYSEKLSYDEMLKGIKPSKSIWEYFNKDITIEGIVCYAMDLAGGWHISYSATELLKDLDWITPKGKLKQVALHFVTGLNHSMHYRKKYDVALVNPVTGEETFK